MLNHKIDKSAKYKQTYARLHPFAYFRLFKKLHPTLFQSITKGRQPIVSVLSSFYGSSSWARTNDPAVNSRMLCQLSY
jgi:hypothetical protein